MFGGSEWWGNYAEGIARQKKGEVQKPKPRKRKKLRKRKLTEAQRQHLQRSGLHISRRHTSSLSQSPFAWLGDRLEGIQDWLESLVILEIIEVLGKVGIVIAAGSFIAYQDIRHEQDVFTAWQTITSAEGQSGNGGRKEAIEFLVSRPWRFPWFCRSGLSFPSCIIRQPAESLAGLDVGLDGDDDKETTGTGAYLARLQLPGSHLFRANLQDADLFGANLQDAFLVEANLQNTFLLEGNLQNADLLNINFQNADLGFANLRKARLDEANLQNADLVAANLQDAYLSRADLRRADLTRANLIRANLIRANLRYAYLIRANLTRASLIRASLTRANLEDADLFEANLSGADLFEANLQDANLEWANLQKANLEGANLQDADLRTNRYITEENSSEEVCTEIFKESNPDLSNEEVQLALDNGWVYPCLTIWDKAVYNDNTRFSWSLFDYEAARMIHIDDLSQEQLCDYSWYEKENTNICS